MKDRPAPDRVFGKKTTLTAEQRSDVCQTCHQKGPKQMLWTGSRHQNEDLACNSCHKVHTNKDKVLAKIGAGRRVLHLPQGAAHPDQPDLAPSDSGRQDDLFGLPQRARLGRPGAGQARQHQRDLLHLPRRKARAVRATSTSRWPRTARSATTRTAASLRACWCRGRRCCASSATRRTWPVASARSAGSPASTRRAPGQTQPLITNTTSGKNVVQIWQGRSCMNCHTQVHGSNNPSATNPTPQLLTR